MIAIMTLMFVGSVFGLGYCTCYISNEVKKAEARGELKNWWEV